MLIGTLFGVIIIPGLYYVFAHLSKGKQLIKNEESEPLSENLVRANEDKSQLLSSLKKANAALKNLLARSKK